METKTNFADDLSAIRNMMERSSKFLSLSGLSGIFAGCCAIAGAAVAYFGILRAGAVSYEDYMQSLNKVSNLDIRVRLFLVALVVLVLALGGSLFFSLRKARRQKMTMWNTTTRRVLLHLFIPLIAGGLFSLLLVWRNDTDLVAPVTLIFYGLALVNAGKFTFGEIHYLGLCEIVLGLLAGLFIHYGLLFWTVGFGILHIVYGLTMYLKYER